MTKQQLREAIRRVIKQELLNEALFLPPTQVAYFDGYDDAKKGKPADVNYYRKDMELDEEKTVANPNAGKWRIVGIESGTPLTKEFYKSKEEAQAAAKKLGQIKSSGIKYVQLKDTMKVHEAAPAPSKPATSPGTKEPPSKTPDKKEPRRPLGNPNVRPAPKAKKATMKEAEMLKQVIKRFKSKKNA
jgi:hypothetical protein